MKPGENRSACHQELTAALGGGGASVVWTQPHRYIITGKTRAETGENLTGKLANKSGRIVGKTTEGCGK